MQTPATPSSALDPIKLHTASGSDPASASFADKYRTALHQQALLAAKLAAAETTANQLVLDLRRVKAEADTLRALVVASGVPAALARLPPITPLSGFVGTHTDLQNASSLALNPPSETFVDASLGLLPSREEDEYTEPPSRRGGSRSSPIVAVSTTYDATKPIPSPQSMTQSPIVPKREISSSNESDTHSAEPNRRTSTSSTTTSVSNAANTTATTATHSVKRSNNPVSTSHMHDHTDNPLPANSLAWTDIIRMRYPNFQRSTVQTSKHAREFIETRQIPFFRVTPTHSLGRSKPTYAIPPEMQKPFLDYFEEKFSGTGVLGRRRPGGDVFAGMPGYDDSFPDIEPDTAATEDKNSQAGSREVGEGQPKSASSGVKRKAPAKRTVSKSETRKNSVSPDADRATATEDAESSEAAAKKLKTTSSSKAVSKSGYILTRYNTIVNRMMPDFKTLSNEARVAIKKGVKQFLLHQLGATFDECIMMTPTENSGQTSAAPKQTYGVPEHLIPGFQQWVYVELKKCFPDLVVLDPKAAAA